jgi:hypothetical protein
MAFNDLFSGSFKNQYRLDSKDGLLTGVTKDGTGAALAACLVYCFATATKAYFATATSDGSGNYRISAPLGVACFLVAYKAGSPDVTGATVNTLVGV